MRRASAWALTRITNPSIPKSAIDRVTKLRSTLHERFLRPGNTYEKLASVYLGTIIGEKFDTKEVEGILKSQLKFKRDRLHTESGAFLFAQKLGIKFKGK